MLVICHRLSGAQPLTHTCPFLASCYILVSKTCIYDSPLRRCVQTFFGGVVWVQRASSSPLWPSSSSSLGGITPSTLGAALRATLPTNIGCGFFAFAAAVCSPHTAGSGHHAPPQAEHRSSLPPSAHRCYRRRGAVRGCSVSPAPQRHAVCRGLGPRCAFHWHRGGGALQLLL